MARTKEQINAEVLQAINAQPLLAGLDSQSQVSVWGQFKDAIVSVFQTNEVLADVQLARLNTIADEAVPGTPSWLSRQAFKFQYGDQIRLNADLSFSYTSPDAAKQIIKRCAITQLDDTREVLIKVVKEVAGVLTPLTPDERASFTAYLNRIKFAGTHLVPISLAPDRVVVNVTVYYAGEYVEQAIKDKVADTINTFLANIAFDGTLYLSKMVDAIQNIVGVQDVTLGQVVARPDSVTLTDPTLTPIVRKYDSQAGYIVSETAVGSTLADTIVMIAV